MKKDVLKQKTFWSSLALIATQLLPLVGVSPETLHIVQVTIGALTAIFLRQAVNE